MPNWGSLPLHDRPRKTCDPRPIPSESARRQCVGVPESYLRMYRLLRGRLNSCALLLRQRHPISTDAPRSILLDSEIGMAETINASDYDCAQGFSTHRLPLVSDPLPSDAVSVDLHFWIFYLHRRLRLSKISAHATHQVS